MYAITPRLQKFQDLQAHLRLDKATTIGILELLWHACAEKTPRGDIGKLTNAEIAEVCEWRSDPDLLISALVNFGWLDRCQNSRLVVHDWHDHASKLVAFRIKDNGWSWASNHIVKPRRDDQYPRPVLPQTHKPKPKPKGKPVSREIQETAKRIFSRLKYNGNDGEFLWQTAAAICMGKLSEHEVFDSIEGTIRCKARNVVAYFRSCLDVQLAKRGKTVKQMVAWARQLCGVLPSVAPQPSLASKGRSMLLNLLRRCPSADKHDDTRSRAEMERKLALVG